MPSIVLNHNITTAAARLGLIDSTHAMTVPVTCEVIARLQQLLGLELAVLASITTEPNIDVSETDSHDSSVPQRERA